MDNYLSDILLILSVIAAPVILSLLLYYGMTISERRRQDAGRDRKIDEAARKLYAAVEGARAAKEKPDPQSERSPDAMKRRTGTSG